MPKKNPFPRFPFRHHLLPESFAHLYVIFIKHKSHIRLCAVVLNSKPNIFLQINVSLLFVTYGRLRDYNIRFFSSFLSVGYLYDLLVCRFIVFMLKLTNNYWLDLWVRTRFFYCHKKIGFIVRVMMAKLFWKIQLKLFFLGTLKTHLLIVNC